MSRLHDKSLDEYQKSITLATANRVAVHPKLSEKYTTKLTEAYYQKKLSLTPSTILKNFYLFVESKRQYNKKKVNSHVRI